jgi:hypothetical protein
MRPHFLLSAFHKGWKNCEKVQKGGIRWPNRFTNRNSIKVDQRCVRFRQQQADSAVRFAQHFDNREACYPPMFLCVFPCLPAGMAWDMVSVSSGKVNCFMRNFVAMAVFAAAILAPSAHAQSTNYSISWYTIAGGGGTSSGGAYSLSGTIGQHSTASMSGGNYSLTGGFWSIIAAVQTPGAPLLSVTLAGKEATISWAAPAAGFVLEESQSLTTGSWSASTTTLSTNSGVISVTVPAGSGYQFFRLHGQ